MQPNPSHLHSMILCELAAILSVLAASPLLAENAASGDSKSSADEPQPITYEHVYGKERITIGGRPMPKVTWVDADHYVLKTPTGWKKTHPASGVESDWYDVAKLKAALLNVEGVTDAEATRMSGGDWVAVNEALGLAVFRNGSQFISIHLDGAQSRSVEGVPEKTELVTLSPTGDAVAFVSGDELWVADFSDSTIRQLTHDAQPGIRNAKADWVYFEEVYNRSWLAFRWSPDGTRIAYQQFDDRHVPTFQISDHKNVVQSFETEHYPKSGDPNPHVRLGIVSTKGGETRWVDTSSYSADDLILAHFNWLPDGSSVYWYAQNRIQTFLDVLVANVTDGTSQKLLRDTTGAWVDNPLDVKFLKDGSFLFFSERTGWRHLYRVSRDGQTITPVTSGEWEVRDLFGLSADESHAFVMGTKDSPIAENLYRIPLESPDGTAIRLTPDNGGHMVSLAPGGKQFIDSHSSITQPIRIALRNDQGVDVRVIDARDAIPDTKYRFGTVEFRDVPMSDGTTTKAIFVLPPKFDASKKYPVWIRTYGGPHSPSVKDLWSSRLVDHALANLGIVVMTFDPRSASGYSAKSAWLCYRNLGTEETKDLISVCDWLAQQTWVDASRIGMSGHSYGGYFTSYAMTHCDKLCAGIAGAPVTDWANYDTIYTERFMSTPQDNPDGYRNASVVANAARLHGRLLVLHGMMDDNVHPENTLQLVHALQEANKQFDLMLFPTARHPIFGDHYQELLWNFIVKAMGRPDAAR